MKYEPHRIDIILDRKCNLQCNNCITTNTTGFNNEYSIIEIIELVIDNLNIKNKNYIHFTGGEPFLQIEKINKIINYINKEHDLEIEYSIYTNLTILNDNIIDTIKQNDIKIHTSIDGLEKENNAIRGGKTFQKVISNIDRLKRQSIKINSITTTLKNENYEKISYEFIKFLKELKIEIWRLNIDYYGIETNPENIADTVFNLYKEAIKNKIKVEGTWIYPFNNLITDNKNGFCPATKGNVISILPDGKINLCPYSNTYIGTNKDSFNQLEKRYIQLKKKQIEKNNKKCKECIIKNYCQTQCLVTIEQNNRELFDWYCKIYQDLTLKLLNFQIQI